MGEEKDVIEQEEKAPGKPDGEDETSRKRRDSTAFLLGLLTILVLSLSYFFVFALPKIQRDRLDFEKERFMRETLLRESYNDCVDAAEAEYESYIKLNGTAVEKQPGAYSAPADVWDTAERRREAALDECFRRHHP